MKPIKALIRIAALAALSVPALHAVADPAGPASMPAASYGAADSPGYPGARTGLGQANPKTPAMIKGLKLDDPLVQAKYLNAPDLLRFLRGTYSEACSRGLVNEAGKEILLDAKKQYSQDQKNSVKQLTESNRVWKMTSFEMEMLFGAGYLNAANYCDCIMKNVSDTDLVNPKKGLDAVEKLSKPVQAACEQQAHEQTVRQVEQRKKQGAIWPGDVK